MKSGTLTSGARRGHLDVIVLCIGAVQELTSGHDCSVLDSYGRRRLHMSVIEAATFRATVTSRERSGAPRSQRRRMPGPSRESGKLDSRIVTVKIRGRRQSSFFTNSIACHWCVPDSTSLRLVSRLPSSRLIMARPSRPLLGCHANGPSSSVQQTQWTVECSCSAGAWSESWTPP